MNEKEHGEYFWIIDTESSYNDEVSEIMKNPLAKSMHLLNLLNLNNGVIMIILFIFILI